MLNWRLVGWATAAGAFLSAGAWGWYERSARSKIEEDREGAYDRLAATVQTLAETQQGRDAFQAQLEKVRAEQEDLSRRFVDSQLRHRSVEDAWLGEKGALQGQVERQEAKLRVAGNDLLSEKEARQEEHLRRVQMEAQLAAERDARKDTESRQRQERAVAEELARKQAAELQRANDILKNLQGDLVDSQSQLQRGQQTVQQLENDLDKTLTERDAAAVASQQTGAALNEAVNDLQRREMDVAVLRNSVGQMQHALAGARREAQQLEKTNQGLTRQVQQLTTQNQHLNAQINQLLAQIKALTDQLNALRARNPPPAPKKPAPVP